MTDQPDHLIEEYYSLHPVSFTFVEDFHVRQVRKSKSDAYEVYLDMELRHQNAEDSRHLILSFQGVRNIRFTPPTRMIIQMIHLEITSIRANGWEGINYDVRETENDTLSFSCEGFTAEVR